MRILILNWRDIKNPAGGGAEQLTQEMAKRWVSRGHEVTQISPGFKGSQSREIIDGVKVIRLGSWWTVHFWAFLYYWQNLRRQTDIVIDEVHWFPFFAGLYARKKTVLLACEVAHKLFFARFNYLPASFWRALEKIYLVMYQDLPTLTISPSTKKELLKEGFKNEKVMILPMGLTVPANLKVFPKEKRPTVIYLGRLNKAKGAAAALAAFRIIKAKLPLARLWFVGSGLPDYEREIKRQIAAAGLNETATFFGFVSEKKKFELLSRAHILVVPSLHEGWGLVVPEAGLVGTPAVVYNVAGLKDVVANGVSGLVCRKNTPADLAENILKIFNDPVLAKNLAKKAQAKARQMSWDKTAGAALDFLKNV